MNTFSSRLSQWLSRNRSFAGTPVPDVRAGRSLGPASGNLGDLYPFTMPNALTGLFAGLTLSGFDPSVTSVRVLEYRSRTGFKPFASGAYAKNAWQKMNGEDWCRVHPNEEPFLADVPAPVHDVDLRFALDATIHRTEEWHYQSRNLPPLYRLHWWRHPDGLLSATAATFTAVSEYTAPFLRPCYAADVAAVDPACLFPLRRSVKLFGGLTVLTAGAEIALHSRTIPEQVDETGSVTPSNTTILVTKSGRSRASVVRTLGGIQADANGNISLAGTGAHKITRRYEELDTETGRVTLIPNTLYILSADKPCCSCDDYVRTYETLRDLFARQKETILRYNKAFETLQNHRGVLRDKMLDAAKPVRVRREKTVIRAEQGEATIRCELAIVYSNVYETEYEHRPVTLRIHTRSGLTTIREVKRIPTPIDRDVRVIRFTSETIDLSTVVVPARSHKAVRLEVALTSVSAGEEFSFTVEAREMP